RPAGGPEPRAPGHGGLPPIGRLPGDGGARPAQPGPPGRPIGGRHRPEQAGAGAARAAGTHSGRRRPTRRRAPGGMDRPVLRNPLRDPTPDPLDPSTSRAPPPSFRRAAGVVEGALREHHLVAPGTSLVVAVSGGADSVFLLLALYAVRAAWALDLRVAHLDHGWRGAQGAADASWVARLAGRLGLPFDGGRGDARRVARPRGLSPEAAAPARPHALLRHPRRPGGAPALARAHTGDARLGRVSLGSRRGGGPVGLGGRAWDAPRPAAGGAGLRLVRPMLGLSREAARAALSDLGQPWREDETNLDPRHPRNRVRLEVLPVLEDIAPGSRRAVLRAASLAAGAGAYLRRQGAAAGAAIFRREGDGVRGRRDAFLALDPALQGEALRWAVRTVEAAGGPGGPAGPAGPGE